MMLAQRLRPSSGRKVRTVRVRVKGGYQPSVVHARVGEPLRIVFSREETASCSEHVVFPAFGNSLPVHQSPHPVFFGGPTVEYYTKLSHFSVGLDADKDVEMVILRGKEQNAAFHAGEVDALYAHTPYLEQAIVQDDAVVLVDQGRGEVAVLANRQIHCLAVR